MLFKSQIDNIRHMLPFWRKKKMKEELRQLLGQKRRILPKEQVAEMSSAIIEKVESMPEFQEAKSVLLYYPIHGEVDMRPLMEAHMADKTILLPVSHRHTIEVRPYAGKKDLHRGRFGIPEPQTKQYIGRVDLIIVPGVAFDRKLHRLGRGGGYYDRFLKTRRATKLAVAYDFQIVDEVPTNWRDQRIDLIVTPTEVIRG